LNGALQREQSVDPWIDPFMQQAPFKTKWLPIRDSNIILPMIITLFTENLKNLE